MPQSVKCLKENIENCESWGVKQWWNLQIVAKCIVIDVPCIEDI